jgi:cell division cycle protein 37
MMDQLIATLETPSDSPIEQTVMQALIQLTTQDHSDAPVVPPGAPGYSQMIASLVDTIKKEIDETNPDDRWKAFIGKLKEHRGKLLQQTKDTGVKLENLEKEDKDKITSEDIHEGFSSGHVNKPEAKPAPKKKTTTKVQAVEQLNAGASIPPTGDQSVSSGAEADVEDIAGDDDEDEHIEPTELGKRFSQIKIGEYHKCLRFISENPDVVAEKETDGLLIEAFNSQMAGKDAYAKQCVHQALLLQYCRQLGRDGVSLFFKR